MMKLEVRVISRKVKSKLSKLKREVVWWWGWRKQQKQYGYDHDRLSHLWWRIKRVLKQKEQVIINEVEELEHPDYTHSLVKEFVELSREREKKKWEQWPGDFKQGDLVAAQLHYWGWGGTSRGAWGGNEVVTSGPEAYGKVYCASPNYMWITWRPKQGDLVEKDYQERSKIRDQYEKCYSSVKRERRAKSDVYKYQDSRWREKEDIVYDYSAIGPDGKKIWFRKIEVSKGVRRWAQRSKIDARFF